MATKDKIVELAENRKRLKFKLEHNRNLYTQFTTAHSGPEKMISVNGMKTWPSMLGVIRQLERVLEQNGVASYSEKIDGSSAVVKFYHSTGEEDGYTSGSVYRQMFTGPYLEAKSSFFSAAYSLNTGEIYYYNSRSAKAYRMVEYLETSLSYFYLALTLRAFIPYLSFFQKDNQRDLELHTEVLYTCLPNSVIYDQSEYDITVYIYRTYPSDSYDKSALIALKKTFSNFKKYSFDIDVPFSRDGICIERQSQKINSSVGFLRNTHLTQEQISELIAVGYDRMSKDPSKFIEKFFSIAKPQTSSPNIEGFVLSIHSDELGSEITEVRRLYKVVNYRFSEIRNLVWAYRNRIKKHVNYHVGKVYSSPWLFSRLHILPLLVADAAGIRFRKRVVKYESEFREDLNLPLTEESLELINLLIDEMMDCVLQDLHLYHNSVPYMRYLRMIGEYNQSHLDEVFHKDRLSCYEVRTRMKRLQDQLNKECVPGSTRMAVHNIITS